MVCGFQRGEGALLNLDCMRDLAQGPGWVRDSHARPACLSSSGRHCSIVDNTSIERALVTLGQAQREGQDVGLKPRGV